MTDPLVEEFQQTQGAYHLAQLIGALKEIQDKDPTFALSACADAILQKHSSKGRPMPNLLMLKGLLNVGGCFYNGFTNHKAT